MIMSPKRMSPKRKDKRQVTLFKFRQYGENKPIILNINYH